MPPDAFRLYTTIFLHHRLNHRPARAAAGTRWLLLRRGLDKRLAPGRWTGLGGRVEASELDALQASALRELHEETGLAAADLATPLTLRRALYHDRPGEPLTGLLYFTGALPDARVPPCTEGSLQWHPPAAFASLDIIETTATALPRLVADVARDPDNRAGVHLGFAHYPDAGSPPRVRWSDGGH